MPRQIVRRLHRAVCAAVLAPVAHAGARPDSGPAYASRDARMRLPK